MPMFVSLHPWPLLAKLLSSLPRRTAYCPPDFDRDIYQACYLIENFFAKITQFRAIATLYENTVKNFPAAVYLVATVFWLN